MSKTATITCEFEYGLQIGQLAPQDVELVKRVTKFGFVNTDRFYSISQAFYGDVLPESELDREKLFTLINKRGADDCWYSELDRYLNSTRFCGLEIEYR